MSLTSVFIRIYTFFRRRLGYSPFRLRIKSSAIHIYAHTCACFEKAAQMYFGIAWTMPLACTRKLLKGACAEFAKAGFGVC